MEMLAGHEQNTLWQLNARYLIDPASDGQGLLQDAIVTLDSAIATVRFMADSRDDSLTDHVEMLNGVCAQMEMARSMVAASLRKSRE